MDDFFFSFQNVRLFKLVFFLNTHTGTDMDVLKMADFSFVLKKKQKQKQKLAHTHRYELYKMADFFHLKMSEFLSLLFFLKTRTHAQIRILQNGWFVSSQSVWIFILAYFWKYAHTHRYRCYKDGRFFIPIFSENTHTRTDMNLTKGLICFISECLKFYLRF